jgi:hypothetical protein
MSQIKITILKEGSGSKKVLSCCFFTMQDAYRPVEQYQRNFMKFLRQTKHMSDFEIRVYTDDSAKDFILEITKNITNVAVLHYDYPPLREKIGHIGTFGTIVRFLPMFEAGLDIVWISDIDIPDHFLDIKVLNLIEKSKVLLYYESSLFYKSFIRRKYTIVAGVKLITKTIFPKALLTRFLNYLNKGKLDEYINYLIKGSNPKVSGKVNKFPYGMDEVFLNTLLYDYIRKHLNDNILVNIDYIPAAGYLYQASVPEADIKYLSFFYNNRTRIEPKREKEILKKYLPKIADKYPYINNFLEKIDRLPKTMSELKIVQADEL